MYRIDGFSPIYGKGGRILGVKAINRRYEYQNFKVWSKNVRRLMFVCEKTNEAIYHYLDLTNDIPQEWYSKNWEDYSGIQRIKAKDLKENSEGRK